MENGTYEQALATVRALSPGEQNRLLAQLIAERDQQSREADRQALQSTQRKREMRWLAEHEAEYAGQWVALEGDRLLSHGSDPHQVRAEARSQGVASPFVVFAEDQEAAFSGGWL